MARPFDKAIPAAYGTSSTATSRWRPLRHNASWTPRWARTSIAVVLVLGLVAAVLLSSSADAAHRDGNAELTTAPTSFPAPSWIDSFGSVALSSPTAADVDGTEVIAFGSENGYVDIVNAATGANLPGWPEPVDLGGTSYTAVESTPTIAYLDGNKNPPSVIVGAGSTYVGHQQGGLVAFNWDGSVRFSFHTKDVFNEWSGKSDPEPDGYDEAVFSTPAVGNITGTGQKDIVFGSYDHRLYALTPSGHLVAGFPFDTEDTIWSSPALYHVRGRHGREDIFIGGDATGRRGCYGGFVYDFTYADHRPKIVWQHCENQTIWSSPAVGVINSTGKTAVVVGTGFGEKPPYKSDTDKLFAFYAAGGKTVPGFPVRTAGPTFGSPAIGTLTGSSGVDIVDTSWCTSCASSPGTSMVYAYTGTGQLIWTASLQGAEDFSSPSLIDLTGAGGNDVLVGSAAGLYPLSGATGDFLYGTSEQTALNTCSVQSEPAIADVPGSGPGTGWHAFETCGGPVALIQIGRLWSYPLPVLPSVPPAWPMWRDGPAHDGVGGGGP